MTPTDKIPDTPDKAKPAPGKTATRKFQMPKIQLPKIRTRVALLALGLLAVAGAGAWFWWQQHAAPAPAAHAPKPIQPIAAPPAPAPAPITQEVARAASAPEPAPLTQEIPRTSAPAAAGPVAPAALEESVREKEYTAPEREPEAAPATPPRSGHVAAGHKHGKAATHAASERAPSEKRARPEEKPASALGPTGSIEKQVKQLTVQQQADNEFRKATGLVQQGNANDAMDGFDAALRLDPDHEAARQALVVLLLEKKRNADAERLLQDGLKRNIKNSGYAMLLARIQIERDASWQALLTLQKTLPYAEDQADYQAFIAALLQRLDRHKEAVTHYKLAVQLAPDSGVWLMGLGISLQALQRNAEAHDAFQRATDTHSLSADLQAFVEQRLKELKHF
jgi:MSHA biogenesis protein MshN